ncbi:hypothetical protein [Pseudorhodobacter wandonensis]|uniref:hypothetical protein n=1 Tax=Pseudorhodobacter wandonensis TaxID=1120568 RepID=UPI00067B24C3|nr:hypothetical protein [Pseudorhodobacter wandonensis]
MHRFDEMPCPFFAHPIRAGLTLKLGGDVEGKRRAHGAKADKADLTLTHGVWFPLRFNVTR